MTRYRWLPSQGTHGWGHGGPARWWTAGSPFVQMMAAEGFDLIDPDDPWFWNTRLNGLNWRRLPVISRLPLLRRLAIPAEHRDWISFGVGLRKAIKPAIDSPEANAYVPYDDRRFWAHSHGDKPILFACAGIRADGSFGKPLRIRSLVTVMSPVRDDMRAIVERAKPNIGYWEHIHSDHSDLIQIAGSLLDGRLGIVRAQPGAHRNTAIAGVGHTGLLEDAAHSHHWRDRGVLDRVRAA